MSFSSLDAIADDVVRYQYVKKKGYVRLHTNKGDLNLELHCDKVMIDDRGFTCISFVTAAATFPKMTFTSSSYDVMSPKLYVVCHINA